MSTEALADTRDMFMAHDMFRREFGLLPGLVLGIAAGDTERADVVAEHLAIIENMLLHHHHGEDEHIWPKLLDRASADIAPLIDTMTIQHKQLDAVLAELDAGTAHWRETAEPAHGTRLATTLQRLNELLVEHLALEEDEVVPLINNHVTAAEWGAMVAGEAADIDPAIAVLTFGMMSYQADPELIADILAQLPPELAPIMAEQGAKAFAEHAGRVHGTSTPGGQRR